MTRTFRALAAVAVAALATGIAEAAPKAKGAAPARRTATAAKPARKPRPAPPLSFLRHNSYSLAEVIAQIKGDRQLLMRFANHFHIAPEKVIPYFEQNLVESYVPETKRYQVWMKRADGSTFWAYQTFRKGERVLALRNGEPVLKWACGNPLATKLPEIQKRKVVEQTKKVLPNVQKRTRYYDVETPFESPYEVEVPEMLAALPLDYSAPISDMTQVVTRQAIPTAVRAFPAVALLPLALVTGGGGGGTPPPPPPPPIPEPSTAALAVMGLAGMGVFTRARRR